MVLARRYPDGVQYDGTGTGSHSKEYAEKKKQLNDTEDED